MSGKVHAVAHAASEEQRMSRRDILFSTLIRRECSALETLDGYNFYTKYGRNIKDPYCTSPVLFYTGV